ncbi:hypothetical protein DY000_02036094 [Brassica cretica]|uniref:Uncharacterized protein n=1 Tax=Brassica cretica TaxID=69181 RepID=A0ABQ7DZG7_BRACR|nr:hypothetical protein DY000_02036094 [Brassica cretica]
MRQQIDLGMSICPSNLRRSYRHHCRRREKRFGRRLQNRRRDATFPNSISRPIGRCHVAPKDEAQRP